MYFRELFPYLEGGINVIISFLRNILFPWMLPFLSHNHFSSTQTSLQGDSPNEEKSSISNPIPAPMPEHDKQHPANESRMSRHQ